MEKKRKGVTTTKRRRKKQSEEEEEEEEFSVEESEDEYQPSPPKKKSKRRGAKKFSVPAATQSRLAPFPGSFHVSGELLWGHLQTIIEGSKSTNHDGIGGPVNTHTGGTILQNDFNYRCAARPGTWTVERVFIDSWLVGYVIHHADVSGADLLKKAAKVGISNGNRHEDRSIVYVGRYDWSWHHGKVEAIKKAVTGSKAGDADGDDDDDDEHEEEYQSLMGGRLLLIDPDHLPSLLSLLRRRPRLEGDKAFRDGAGDPFGVHLQLDDTEYELGWLCFSGQKHAKFENADELVGIVYDGAYCALEGGEDGHEVKVE